MRNEHIGPVLGWRLVCAVVRFYLIGHEKAKSQPFSFSGVGVGRVGQVGPLGRVGMSLNQRGVSALAALTAFSVLALFGRIVGGFVEFRLG